MAGTGFSPRQPLADLGMASTRIEGQLPGVRLAYWSRPLPDGDDRRLADISSRYPRAAGNCQVATRRWPHTGRHPQVPTASHAAAGQPGGADAARRIAVGHGLQSDPRRRRAVFSACTPLCPACWRLRHSSCALTRTIRRSQHQGRPMLRAPACQRLDREDSAHAPMAGDQTQPQRHGYFVVPCTSPTSTTSAPAFARAIFARNKTVT